MTELIAFRAIQGLGGGGLMVSAQAAIGDVVLAARARQVHRGCSARVFGVASVVGPLIGGFFTTHLSLALDLLRQPAARRRRARRAGRARCRARSERVAARGRLPRAPRCSRSSLTSLVLLTTLGGTPVRLGLAVHRRPRGRSRSSRWSAFVCVERRAAEPVLPPRAVPQPRVRGDERDRLRRRLRAVRRAHVPAAVPAGRARRSARPSPGCSSCR